MMFPTYKPCNRAFAQNFFFRSLQVGSNGRPSVRVRSAPNTAITESLTTGSSAIKNLAFLKPNPTAPDIRGEKLDFTMISEGDWNVGHLNQKASSDKFTMGATVMRGFAGGTTWRVCDSS